MLMVSRVFAVFLLQLEVTMEVIESVRQCFAFRGLKQLAALTRLAKEWSVTHETKQPSQNHSPEAIIDNRNFDAFRVLQ